MLTIKGLMNEKSFEYEFPEYETKETTPDAVRTCVNELWKGLIEDPGVTQLRAYLPNGEVLMPNKDVQMTWKIVGTYSEGKNGKRPTQYVFECDNELKEGQQFITMPNGIPAIATVVSCSWVPRKEVVAACKGHNLFKIKYIVKAV